MYESCDIMTQNRYLRKYPNKYVYIGVISRNNY